MFDLIIKNGTVIDGTGSLMYKADIGIKENKIAEIGKLYDEKGEIEIDASERLVCPGFVDVNNHSDTYWQIFSNPNLESLVYQGVTTIVGGTCGSSLAPLADPSTIQSIQKWANINQVNVDWLSMKEFFKFLENKKLSVNFATLTGHGTLRRGILKDQMRSPEESEIGTIENMLKNSLKEGSLGLSSGLIYTHARNASTEELIRLCKLVAKKNGIYATHIRDEKDGFKEAIEEALRIAEESKVKLHISHLKAMGEKNWNLMDEALFLIGKAGERGVDISFDVYPYTNTGSVLYTLLPEWVSAGGKKMMLSRLRDPQIRAKVISEMRNSGFDFSKVEISISPLNKTLARRKIREIAEAQEKSVEDAIIDVLLASEGRVITSMEVLSESNIEKAVLNPAAIVASNGAGYNLEHAESGELVHPRSFGTFPKFISKYVLRKKLLTWEQAIRKITSFPADRFGIKKRGRIEKGYFADIVVINRDEIEDLASVDNPYRYGKGMDFVIVNGKLALSEGRYTGIRNGELIKK